MISAYRDGMMVRVDRPVGLGDSSWTLTLAEAAKLLQDLKQVFTDRPVYEDEERE